MQTQRPLLTVLAVLLLAPPFLQAQNAERTLVKSFNLQGQNQVFFDVDGDYQISERTSPSLRVQMVITLQDGNDSTLKTLITTRRYDLLSKVVDGELVIFAPVLDRKVSIAGKEISDSVRYEVQAPATVNIRFRSSEATANVTPN